PPRSVLFPYTTLFRSVVRFHFRPAAVLQTEPGGGVGMHVQRVAGHDLPQPGVLRTPGVIHEGWPLGDGAERISRVAGLLALEGRSEEHTSELQSRENL